jgi:hypothetical protein
MREENACGQGSFSTSVQDGHAKVACGYRRILGSERRADIAALAQVT